MSVKSKHHTLLHFVTSSSSADSEIPATVSGIVDGLSTYPESNGESSCSGQEAVVTMTTQFECHSIVLLSTVQAEINDARGNSFPVRMFWTVQAR